MHCSTHIALSLAALLDANAASWDSLVVPLEEMQHRLARTWSPVGHMNGVVNSDELRAAYNACLPLLTAWHTELAQNERLYRAYETIARQRGRSADARAAQAPARTRCAIFGSPASRLPAEQKAALQVADGTAGDAAIEVRRERARRDQRVVAARHAGKRDRRPAAADRRACARRRAVASARRLVLHARCAELSGRDDARASTKRCVASSITAWVTRASDQGADAGRWDNSALMAQILELRHEIAQLVGFPNYAEYSLATKMASSVDEVRAFLEQLARQSRPVAQREFDELTRFAGRALNAWDVAFHAERLKRERLQVVGRSAAPVLPAAARARRHVRGRRKALRRAHRASAAASTSITRTCASTTSSMPTARGAAASTSICTRAPKKRGGAWMDECIGRKQLGDTASLPVAYLVCNFMPPVGAQPVAPDARRSRDDVPRVRPRPAPHAHARRLPEHRRHQRRRVGRGRAAEPVHGELRVARRSAAADFGPRRDRRSRCRKSSCERLLGDAHVPGGHADGAAAGVRAVRSAHSQRERAAVERQRSCARSPKCARRSRSCTRRRSTASRTASSTSSRAATRRATTATSGRKCSLPMRSAHSRSRASSTRKSSRRFLASILEQGGSRDAMEAFVEFRGRKPQIEPLLKQLGSGGLTCRRS